LSLQSILTQNIFISYRRDDSAAYAGRICDHLAALIGAQRVFMDVEDIHPGQNFAQAIDQTLARCTSVLVIVGPRWIEILRARAARGEEDYVVHEIAAALAAKKNVVPVFVGGATAAELTGLPPALADLSFHQAVELHDSSFKDDCTRLAKALKLTRSFSFIPWLIGAALLALLVVVAANFGLGPWHGAHERKIRIAQLLKTAGTQASQNEYESAFQSYRQVLAIDLANPAALTGQVAAAMLWLENFHVLTPEGQKAEDIAAPMLAQLKAVLEAGLARTGGHDTRAADILAHLGWAHWMNEKIAFKEFGNAERFFTQALAIDPSNVFANAFLGNWLLQTHGDSQQALAHFQTALATGKQRALVRSMQLGGLYLNQDPGMRAAFIKALNDVRVNHEPLDANLRDRVSYLYSPTVSDAAELRETLAAVPPDDAWKTFEWLNRARPGEAPVHRDFVHASLAELAGNRAAALAEFKTLKGELRAGHFNGRIADYTDAAIARLAK
jgi:tetratricopeptide (TPR) repeat protein